MSSKHTAINNRVNHMKTLNEIRDNAEQDELNEGRLIRKGTAILFAKNTYTWQPGRTVLQVRQTETNTIQLCLRR